MSGMLKGPGQGPKPQPSQHTLGWQVVICSRGGGLNGLHYGYCYASEADATRTYRMLRRLIIRSATKANNLPKVIEVKDDHGRGTHEVWEVQAVRLLNLDAATETNRLIAEASTPNSSGIPVGDQSVIEDDDAAHSSSADA